MSAITTTSLSPSLIRTKPPILLRTNPNTGITGFTGTCRYKKNRSLVCFSSLEAENWEQWLEKLPEKKKPLYSHSLPCIEAWLRKLGFEQSKDDRALWLAEMKDWHAQLSLDITDLYIRYLKSGPGNLEKDMERRFSYALSREDIENAILGGP